MVDKKACFAQIDNETLPAVRGCLRDGFLVVLVGASGTGKSVLAGKALPSARVISGLDDANGRVRDVDSDLIFEEIHSVASNESILYRDRALALEQGVIMTGQIWEEVVPHLADLEKSRFKVFDLNRVWRTHGLDYYAPNTIPPEVLADRT